MHVIFDIFIKIKQAIVMQQSQTDHHDAGFFLNNFVIVLERSLVWENVSNDTQQLFSSYISEGLSSSKNFEGFKITMFFKWLMGW
jgi:hypothetical protein